MSTPTPLSCGAEASPQACLAQRTDSRELRLSLVKDLKLLFAALGAGGSVVPLGDNRRTVRLLASYAESLRDH